MHKCLLYFTHLKTKLACDPYNFETEDSFLIKISNRKMACSQRLWGGVIALLPLMKTLDFPHSLFPNYLRPSSKKTHEESIS